MQTMVAADKSQYKGDGWNLPISDLGDAAQNMSSTRESRGHRQLTEASAKAISKVCWSSGSRAMLHTGVCHKQDGSPFNHK